MSERIATDQECLDFDARARHLTAEQPTVSQYESWVLLNTDGPYIASLSSETVVLERPGITENVHRSIHVYDSETGEREWSVNLFALELEQLYPVRPQLPSRELARHMGNKALDENGQGTWAIMTLVAQQQQKLLSGQPLKADDIATIDRFFNQHIQRGGTQTTTQFYRQFRKAASLTVTERSVTGQLEHVGATRLELPSLCVRACTGTKAIVYERQPNGTSDAYVEVSDLLVAQASCVKPENVGRDEEGNVMVVGNDKHSKEIVAIAERAAGLRAVKSFYLQDLGRAILQAQQ